MSMVTIASVKGAPGVTTLSLLVAAELGRRVPGELPRVVVVECDSSGGDLAPRLGLPGVPGIATLALAARRGLGPDLVLDHCQLVPGTARVGLLAGVAGPEQGAAIGWLIGDLGRALAAPDLLAVVDTGRVRVDDAMAVELAHAALVSLIVSRSDPGSVLHLSAAADAARSRGLEPELVVIGDRPYSPTEVARATGLELAGWLPDDRVAVSELLPATAGGSGGARATGRGRTRPIDAGGGVPGTPRIETGQAGRMRPVAHRDHSPSPDRRRYRAARDALAALADAIAPRLGMSGPARPWQRRREQVAR